MTEQDIKKEDDLVEDTEELVGVAGVEEVKDFSEKEIKEVEAEMNDGAESEKSEEIKPAFEKKSFKKNFSSRRKKRFTKPRSEFDQKIIKIRRVTRVVSGGRRFSFSVAMVLGNRKGKVGVGIAKAGDTALAIEKAIKKAKKNMLDLKLTDNNSIPYDVSKKYTASVIKITPTKIGKGLSAGSSLKIVLELAGITDVTGKILSRSKNQLNIAMATLGALKDFKK
ncbi:MAG: 30S ribosomal protein S5 [Patescibacteria group bacterium]